MAASDRDLANSLANEKALVAVAAKAGAAASATASASNSMLVPRKDWLTALKSKIEGTPTIFRGVIPYRASSYYGQYSQYSRVIVGFYGLDNHGNSNYRTDDRCSSDAEYHATHLDTLIRDNANDPDTIWHLGIVLAHRKKITQASVLFRKAAEMGHINAFYDLGVCFEGGLGEIRQDPNAAMQCFLLAAEGGDPRAQYALGSILEEQGALREMIEWYTLAAKQYYSAAEFSLARCLDEGTGVKKDRAKALKLYQRAALNGEARAQAFGPKPERLHSPQGIQWLTKKLDGGDPRAEFALAMRYRSEEGMKQNLWQSFQLLDRIARQGNLKQDLYSTASFFDRAPVVNELLEMEIAAHFELGKCYREGLGVPRNELLAIYYIELAKTFRKKVETSYGPSSCIIVPEQGNQQTKDFQRDTRYTQFLLLFKKLLSSAEKKGPSDLVVISGEASKTLKISDEFNYPGKDILICHDNEIIIDTPSIKCRTLYILGRNGHLQIKDNSIFKTSANIVCIVDGNITITNCTLEATAAFSAFSSGNIKVSVKESGRIKAQFGLMLAAGDLTIEGSTHFEFHSLMKGSAALIVPYVAEIMKSLTAKIEGTSNSNNSTPVAAAAAAAAAAPKTTAAAAAATTEDETSSTQSDDDESLSTQSDNGLSTDSKAASGISSLQDLVARSRVILQKMGSEKKETSSEGLSTDASEKKEPRAKPTRVRGDIFNRGYGGSERWGIESFYGVDGRIDYSRTVFWGTSSSGQDAKDPDVAWHVGLCYAHGLGTVQNLPTAASYFRFAADNGHVNAFYDLGICFEGGLGNIRTSKSKAMECYLIAAEAGDPRAQHALGMEAEERNDMPEAIKWYQLAAKQGEASAEFALGQCYATGNGVEKDAAKALEYYIKASESGETRVIRILGPKPNNLASQKGVQWLAKSTEKSDPRAELALALCYRTGMGVNKNPSQAFQRLDKITRREHLNFDPSKKGSIFQRESSLEDLVRTEATALHYVGICYREGFGIDQNELFGIYHIHQANAFSAKVNKSQQIIVAPNANLHKQVTFSIKDNPYFKALIDALERSSDIDGDQEPIAANLRIITGEPKKVLTITELECPGEDVLIWHEQVTLDTPILHCKHLYICCEDGPLTGKENSVIKTTGDIVCVAVNGEATFTNCTLEAEGSLAIFSSHKITINMTTKGKMKATFGAFFSKEYKMDGPRTFDKFVHSNNPEEMNPYFTAVMTLLLERIKPTRPSKNVSAATAAVAATRAVALLQEDVFADEAPTVGAKQAEAKNASSASRDSSSPKIFLLSDAANAAATNEGAANRSAAGGNANAGDAAATAAQVEGKPAAQAKGKPAASNDKLTARGKPRARVFS